ncbi:hypothetical protein [Bacillus sp. JJ1562]|uniref:hypothetical protein n=1 Tax=Bacillus sp. JJ1562 TaxID=3122960 RepID=UPI003001699A
MKKIIIAIIGIAIILGVLYVKSGSTSFDNVVSGTPTITSIEIIRGSDDKEVVIDDKNKVTNLMNGFSMTELKEKSMGSIEFDESYWITLRADGKRKFGLTIYDEKYILVFEYESSKQNSYRIIRGFDSSSIEQYFQ